MLFWKNSSLLLESPAPFKELICLISQEWEMDKKQSGTWKQKEKDQFI